MLLVSIIFNGEGILPEQGVGRGSQEWARRIDTGSVCLLRHMGKKQIILIFDFYLKTSVYASEPLILLEEKLYFFCLAAADDVHGSGKNEDGHLHHDRHPDMQGEPSPFYNLFHGLLYCADCGKSMQARYEKVGRADVNRTTKAKREPIDKAYYICQTYNRLSCKVCPSHKIEARALYNLVLTDIRELAAQAIRDEDAFYGRLVKRLENRYRTDASSLHRELNLLMARNQEIDDTFLSLYTDKSKGILTEQRFLKLTVAMENEQKENNGRIAEIQALLRDSIDQESDIRQFITEIRQCEAITELDEGILNHLIDKIMIGDVKKVNGEKVQEVRIFYNFVGEVAEMAA